MSFVGQGEQEIAFSLRFFYLKMLERTDFINSAFFLKDEFRYYFLIRDVEVKEKIYFIVSFPAPFHASIPPIKL